MTALYPLRLVPVSKEILWGGHKLKDRYHKTAPFDKLAESWELSVRPQEMNRIADGPASDLTLEEYIRQAGNGVVSARYDGGRFPLLIKFIDACDKLSIQVHPDDAYALAHEGELGKTEMWYIVEAEPGAALVYGLKESVSASGFADAVHAGRIADTLRYVPVHAGECYFIPSGQVHAIGVGILIAEIQQNSNVTYRVYDYDRRQADGSLRALHTEKALDVVRVRTDAEIDGIRFARGKGDASVLADCPYFRVRRLTGNALPCTVETKDSFISLLCTDGAGVLLCEGKSYPVERGDSYFIPRGCAPCELRGTAEVLLTETAE
ncbi:MAG: type I phosphomannose isomerase catalytic subunit [Eubacteriales bacterium]